MKKTIKERREAWKLKALEAKAAKFAKASPAPDMANGVSDGVSSPITTVHPVDKSPNEKEKEVIVIVDDQIATQEGNLDRTSCGENKKGNDKSVDSSDGWIV